MRILILGDGVTDLGIPADDLSPEQEGVLPILVRKLLEPKSRNLSLEFKLREISSIRVFKKPSERLKSTWHGLDRKLQIAAELPEGKWADAIVAIVDRDERKYQSRIVELNESRDVMQSKGKLCAVGMAIEEVEAWLLADEKALREALGDKNIQRQPDPESLSSRNEASDKNPKGRLDRIIQNAFGREPSEDEFPEIYAQITAAMDIEVLEKRCPQGFCPFAEQVRELI